MTERVIIHTDGACSGNPGPGGWGAVLQYGDTVKELKGGAALTTNNQMELTAAIEALNALKRPVQVELHTDSVYVKDGLNKWIHGWKRNGWRTADKKPVKNADLWQDLLEATARHGVRWHWVKGPEPGDEHTHTALNDRADRLAVAASHAVA
jgi:ribonuclease HI